jgi:hypothetical protein
MKPRAELTIKNAYHDGTRFESSLRVRRVRKLKNGEVRFALISERAQFKFSKEAITRELVDWVSVNLSLNDLREILHFVEGAVPGCESSEGGKR